MKLLPAPVPCVQASPGPSHNALPHASRCQASPPRTRVAPRNSRLGCERNPRASHLAKNDIILAVGLASANPAPLAILDRFLQLKSARIEHVKICLFKVSDGDLGGSRELEAALRP